jgi:hypothetical protein
LPEIWLGGFSFQIGYLLLLSGQVKDGLVVRPIVGPDVPIAV